MPNPVESLLEVYEDMVEVLLVLDLPSQAALAKRLKGGRKNIIIGFPERVTAILK